MNKARLLSGEGLPVMFIRFYTVGYILFALPWTRSWFVSVTALSLLLVIGLIFFYNRDWRIRTLLWFTFIVVTSFFLEMAGIASGKIFGVYQYGKGLGWQIEGTPLIIGLNWLFLVYASRDITMEWGRLRSPGGRIFFGAFLMVTYDLLLEWVAPVMQMWRFETGYPPFMNFVVWFIAAAVYHTGFEILHIRTGNLPARWLFVIQWFFFLFIAFYNLLFPL